jgi:hypothetical protein
MCKKSFDIIQSDLQPIPNYAVNGKLIPKKVVAEFNSIQLITPRRAFKNQKLHVHYKFKVISAITCKMQPTHF